MRQKALLTSMIRARTSATETIECSSSVLRSASKSRSACTASCLAVARSAVISWASAMARARAEPSDQIR